MARYVARVPSGAAPERVYNYLANFTTIAEWDPGVTSAELLSGPPATEGAVYRVVAALARARFHSTIGCYSLNHPIHGNPAASCWKPPLPSSVVATSSKYQLPTLVASLSTTPPWNLLDSAKSPIPSCNSPSTSSGGGRRTA